MDEIAAKLDDINEDVDRSEIQSKLANMSFEDLQKLKERLGTKLYKEAYFGVKNVGKKNFKRLNKNRPREESSKSKPKLQPLLQKTKNIRDPRFDPLCGSFDKNTFEKNYSFINKMKQKEKQQLKKMLKGEKNENKASKIKYLIERMDNQERERLRRKKEEDKKYKERQEQIQALKHGEKPHFKTKFERKLDNIVERYEELKDSGKLMKYIERKQKKNNNKYKKSFKHIQE